MSYCLYGTPASLYTGKARSYLIKQRIDFESRAVGDPHFREDILPKIGRWIIPVLECPDGTLVQDSSEIIDYFETRGPTRHPAIPSTPLHRLIGQIFELFGGEGLLRPAMHFRWNFDDANLAFLARDFPAALAPPNATTQERDAIFVMASQRMRRAMASFGVSAETAPTIEASYGEFLDLFEAHLKDTPYLLGGRPTIGDYGLIAPLYAHLARDPFPAALMKDRAHRVWRWVERMNAPDLDYGEYGGPSPALFESDGVPETLKQLLRFIAKDYLPEIEAFVGFTNSWLNAHPEIVPGTNGLPRPQDRVIGQVEFVWRGHPLRVAVLPYRLYLLQKIQAVFDGASILDRGRMNTLLEETGLNALTGLRTTRHIVRKDHLEVWSA
ncbi:MAG: glutathione S-transferase family protein [Alphaproteobacteria bacterium]|nr:glutathione S-transferase family protein [Alphaproteobacteria bacterium]